MSRKEALATGSWTYFTGKPCKHGHVDIRYTNMRSCRTCTRVDAARWGKANSGKKKAYAASRQDIENQQARDRYTSDSSGKKISVTRWRKLNPGVVNRKNAERKMHIQRATPPWLTAEHKQSIREMYELAAMLGMHVDHIMPLRGETSSGLHVPWNLQLLAPVENIKKGNKIVTT